MNVTDLHMSCLIDRRSFCTFVLLSKGGQGCPQLAEIVRYDVILHHAHHYIELGSIAFIIVVILVYSGCALYMLQHNFSFSDENSVIHPTFENFLIVSFLNQF